MSKYDAMTQEEFNDCLERVVYRYSQEQLLYIPGVWEVLSEYFNNDVLDLWEQEQGEGN